MGWSRNPEKEKKLVVKEDEFAFKLHSQTKRKGDPIGNGTP